MLSIDLIPWYVKAAAVAAVIASIFGAGVYVESLRWSKADSKHKLAVQAEAIVLLKKNLQTIQAVLGADAAQAITDANTLEELERITNDAVAKASTRACLSPDTTDRLRNLWD